MNPDIKAIWVAALRSGDYKQGRNALRDQYNRCCPLGVLCDIVAPELWKQTYGFYLHDGHTGVPGLSVLRIAGIDGDQMNKLISLSDKRRARFPFIANYIEKNL